MLLLSDIKTRDVGLKPKLCKICKRRLGWLGVKKPEDGRRFTSVIRLPGITSEAGTLGSGPLLQRQHWISLMRLTRLSITTAKANTMLDTSGKAKVSKRAGTWFLNRNGTNVVDVVSAPGSKSAANDNSQRETAASRNIPLSGCASWPCCSGFASGVWFLSVNTES